MSDQLTHKPLAGIVPIVAAPFTPTGRLDEDSLQQLVRHLLGTGVAGLTLFGLATEFYKLTDAERAAIRANVFLHDGLANALDGWIRRHYRDRVAPDDLGDPALLDESRRALDELSTMLGLPAIYPFQR